MDILKRCSCGNSHIIEVSEESFKSWKDEKLPIQEAFKDLNSFTRECLLTGMCFDCQSKLFNTPKPGEDWGEIIDSCELCGAPLYSKDFDSGVCPCCQCGLGEDVC